MDRETDSNDNVGNSLHNEVADKVRTLEEQLLEHIAYTKQEFDDANGTMTRLQASIEANNLAILQVRNNTDQIVDAWRDIQGAVTIGVQVQKIGLWIVKWPLIGTGLYVILKAIFPDIHLPPK